MATLISDDEIPDGTDIFQLIADGLLVDHGNDTGYGYYSFDLDVVAEPNPADFQIVFYGENIEPGDPPSGGMDFIEFDALFTSQPSWMWIENLPLLDVAAFDALIKSPATTAAQIGEFLLGGQSNLVGGKANDILNGYSGDDVIDAQSGNDVLIGGRGADFMIGSRGADRLTGGAGDDTFVFNARPGRASADRITDYGRGADHFLLDATDFTALSGDVLAEGQLETGTEATQFGTRIVYDPANGRLYYDEDGVGGIRQHLFAIVDDFTPLSAGDFLIVA